MRTVTLALLLVSVQCGIGEIIKDIDEDKKEEKCSGSVKIFDKDDKELIVVSHTHTATEKLKYDGKSKGGKVQLEGNCCFEARQKSAGRGGKSLALTDNKEYSVSFPVKYVIETDCGQIGAGTPVVPIVITLSVLAVLAAVAAVIYMKKRRGMTVVTQDAGP